VFNIGCRTAFQKSYFITGGIHNMETEKFSKQMIDFQKATFDNTFTAVTMLQDQAERMVNTMLEQTTWLPEESRRAIDEMVGTYKKGRADFKGVMDENFVKLADLFEAVPTLKKPQASPMSKTK
jgi:division protein CdvB (Snf7/Vps24/ESCRT-III family)